MAKDYTNESGANVGKNLTSLLDQTGITIIGFSHGANISLNHARVIKNGKSSITSKTARKIADFFEIEAGLLFLPKIIKLKDPLKIASIAKFYQDNIDNIQFFTKKALENRVSFILYNYLIPDEIMSNWIRSFQIVNYVNENKKYQKYKDLFNIRNVSKALERIYKSTDALDKNDLYGNGKVFQYKRKMTKAE